MDEANFQLKSNMIRFSDLMAKSENCESKIDNDGLEEFKFISNNNNYSNSYLK